MGMSWEMNMPTKAPFIHTAKAEIAVFLLWGTTFRYILSKWITCGVSYFDLSLSKTAWWNCVMEVWWLWHLNMAHMEECQASDILKSSPCQKQKHMVFLFLTWAGNGESIPFMHWREYAFNRVDFCFYFLQERSWFWMGLSWEINMLIKAPFIHTAKAETAVFLLWCTTPDIHVRSGIPVVFLIFTWVWVKQHDEWVWCKVWWL